jgi:hypothetical protein
VLEITQIALTMSDVANVFIVMCAVIPLCARLLCSALFVFSSRQHLFCAPQLLPLSLIFLLALPRSTSGERSFCTREINTRRGKKTRAQCECGTDGDSENGSSEKCANKISADCHSFDEYLYLHCTCVAIIPPAGTSSSSAQAHCPFKICYERYTRLCDEKLK